MNYRYPLKSWMVDVFRDRQAHRNKSNSVMPFVMLSSAAKIVQSDPKATRQEVTKQIANILKNPNDFKPKYYGCIITNHIDTKLNYNTGKTIVGFDFRGKPIEVEGEVGRKISPVIIESVSIKVDGSAAFSKMATVRMRCFSVQQFELLEQFFLQMGMHVLLEFGDNSHVQELINNNIIAPKNNYTEFLKKYPSYKGTLIDDLRSYLNDCKNAKGSYDRYAGILYDYNYKIEQDGTILVTASYIQGNEINYAMPLTYTTGFGTLKLPTEDLSLFKQIIYNISNDTGMDLELLLKLDEKEWKNEFFNFKKESETLSDKTISSTPYVSLRFIVEVMLNNVIAGGGQNPDFTMLVPNSNGEQIFKIGKDKFDKIIPIKVHKYMTAQDGTVLFPNDALPSYDSDDKGEIIAREPLINASINGKSIMVNDTVEFMHPVGSEEIKLAEPYKIANALNIFIDYNEVLTVYRKSYNRIDFLSQILQLINDRSFGFFRLGYGNIIENKPGTIVDFKLYSEEKTPAKEKDPARIEYRFNPLHYNSIIRNFDYTFTMDAIMASVAIRNANSFVAENKYVNENFKANSSENADRIMGLSSYASHTTIDGLYSINQIQYEALTPPAKFNQYVPKTSPKDEKKTPDPNLGNAQITTLIKYKLNPNDNDSIVVLAVAQPIYLYTFLTGDKERFDTNTQVLSNISITFKIDGISGFNIGETFNIDGVPEMRNKLGQFRISNIEHSIDTQNGWVTTIHADWVYAYNV